MEIMVNLDSSNMPKIYAQLFIGINISFFFFFVFFFILIYFNTLGVSSNDSLAIVREFLGSSCMGRSRKIRKGGRGGGADNVFCVF